MTMPWSIWLIIGLLAAAAAGAWYLFVSHSLWQIAVVFVVALSGIIVGLTLMAFAGWVDSGSH